MMYLKTKKIINNINTKLTINQPTNLNIIDLDNKSNQYSFNFYIKNSCVINLSTFTWKNNKEIKLDFHLLKSNCEIKINVNSLTINNLSTKINLCAKNADDIENVNIDMQVSGVSVGTKAKIACIPIYELNNNKINATHGLNMGTFNEDELFALKTRGIEVNEAKTMLIWSKFKKALVNISSNEENMYYKFILDKWRNNYEKL